MIADEIIHGSLPHSGGPHQQPQFRSVRSARPPDQRLSPFALHEQQGWGEWDASVRLYEDIQMRRSEAGEKDRPPCHTRIEDETAIIPRAAAEVVCEEVSVWLGEPMPRLWVAELAERANVVYQHNTRFRRLLRTCGDTGNGWLLAFMRHWLCGLLASRRSDLYQRLPGTFAAGQKLPPPLGRR